VETRLQKLESGEYDGIVLARAGLLRLGLEQYVHQIFETHEMIPAVGQAALGLEIRTEDIELQTCLDQINHRPTHQAVLAERTLLNDLRGGCLAPIGGWAREVEKNCLQLDAVVLDPQGKKRLFQSQSGPLGEAQTIGKEVAEKLLADGAAALINAAREPNIP